MNRKIALFLAAAMVAALISGCGAKSADTYKIGVNLELSGGVATYGQSTLVGIEMAVAEINAAGGINGKPVELVKYDNKSDPAEATTIATKLMAQDGVLAILGPATSGSFKATIPVADKNKVPVISASATVDDVTVDENGVKEYAFRICYNDSFQGNALAKYARENLGANNAVVLKDIANDYCKGVASSFASAFTAAGGAIAAEESFSSGDTDFNAILTKIKSANFDAILLSAYYQEAGLIIKQARALGITCPILGPDGYDSPSLAELAGADALNNVYYTNHYSSLDKDPSVLKFIADFSAANGKEPDSFNALGYDVAMFAIDAISRAAKNGEPTPEAVKEALASTAGFTGVTGSITVDENHNAVKGIVIIRLENGVPVSSEKAG
ncbi:MAG: ABC transporter substrate-binding protein [Clostridiaceae bacterium]|nr:ABC transporter substrate-binding protein [Eubacteriales bacterium]